MTQYNVDVASRIHYVRGHNCIVSRAHANLGDRIYGVGCCIPIAGDRLVTEAHSSYLAVDSRSACLSILSIASASDDWM